MYSDFYSCTLTSLNRLDPHITRNREKLKARWDMVYRLAEPVGERNPPVVETALQFPAIVAGAGPSWIGLHPGKALRSMEDF